MFALLLGNRELSRICSSKSYKKNCLMIEAFAAEIAKSRKLRKYTFTAVDEISHTEEALTEILSTGYLDETDQRLLANVTLCLDALRMIQVVYNRINYLKSQAFDLTHDGEHYLLLDILWINLTVVSDASKSNQEYNCPLADRDWKLIGFQSNDPTTDFRGMGILGLHQLVYFTTKRTTMAALILTESKKRGIHFPFAVTGIHITQFVLALFRETRLHRIFFSRYESIVFSVSAHHTSNHTHNSNHTNNNNKEELQINRASYNDICVDKSCDILHETYCDIYEEFFKLWMQRNPTHLMEFTSIFDELKEMIREKYLPI